MAKPIFAFLMAISLTGCAALYTALPYLPAAKVGYCAAADDETRAAIREKYNLPQVINCPGD